VGQRVILGTAGHVDHGKTALVKALTGVDTDRLIEEKQRGITTELGFAHLLLPGGGTAGVIDVPGHEKLVKAMVAGAFGLDLVMLVVAVDEGVMPQTREHLDICRLLGVRRGLVALTKVDLLAAQGRELEAMARDDVRALVKDTFLEGAPVVGVSARTAEGIPALVQALAALAAPVDARPFDGPALLPIDRSFTVKGFGTVVTGTVLGGALKVDDAVDLVPGGPLGLRVRGLQAYGVAVDQAQAGMRAAINLAGVDTLGARRGMVLASAGTLRPTRMIDVELELLAKAPHALKTGSKALLHLGTAMAPATVTLLDRARLEPGERAPLQLTLGAEVAAAAGQRFVLRGFAPSPGRERTLAGGAVIDPHPRRHRRHKPEAAALVEALRDGEPADRLRALYRDAGFHGARLHDLAARLALPPKIAERALALLASRGEVVIFDRAERMAIFAAHLQALAARAVAEVEAFARAHPLEPGISREALRGAVSGVAPKLFAKVIDARVEAGQLEVRGEWISPAGHASGPAGEASPMVQDLKRALAAAGLAPPSVPELAAAQRAAPAAVLAALKHLQRAGEVVRVKDDLYFDAQAISALKDRLLAYLQAHLEIDIQAFKGLVGQSRKWTVPLGEYFDAERVTLRVGDRRVLRGGA